MNDGADNLNNVLSPEEIQTQTQTQTQTEPETLNQTQDTPTTATAAMSGVTPDSTTAILAANVPKEEQNGHLPGAFPDTPGQESDQVFSVNPIPASGGYGNPVKLNPGEKVPDPSTIHGNTIDSTVKLDKESYEKSDSVPLGSAGTQIDTAGPSAFTLPPVSKNTIPESSLPMGGPAQRAASTEQEQLQAGGPAQQAAMADPGYTIQSAHPSSTTAALAAQVPLEKEKEKETNGTAQTIQSAHPSSTTAGLAAGVPLEKEKETNGTVPVPEVPEMVKESLSEAHQDPEAAANKEAVEEKKAVEQELTKKVDLEESAGTPAPTETAATTTKAPGPTNAGLTASHLTTTGFDSADVSPTSSPPPGHAAPTSAPPTSEPKSTEGQTQPITTTGVETTPTAQTSTPAKQTTPAAGSQSSHKDDKKKHRLSGFFNKLKEKLK